MRETRRTPGQAAALAVVAYGAFLALHVVLAWDGGRVLTTLVPAIGPWLGPAGWAVYAVAAALAVPLVGLAATGIVSRPRPGWLRLSAPVVAAGLPFLLFGLAPRRSR